MTGFGHRCKRHKYGAKRSQAPSGMRELEGSTFDSKGERNRAVQLALLQRAGEISSLSCQVKVDLTCGIGWRLDFRYVDESLNAIVYEDFKGVETQDFKLKVKLWKGFGPALLRITKSSFPGGFYVDREVTPDAIKETTDGRQEDR